MAEFRDFEVLLFSKVLPKCLLVGARMAREGSLALLKDRLDCYRLHWRGSRALEETIAASTKLLRFPALSVSMSASSA